MRAPSPVGDAPWRRVGDEVPLLALGDFQKKKEGTERRGDDGGAREEGEGS